MIRFRVLFGVILGGAVLLGASLPVQGAVLQLSCTIDEAQETPPNGSPGTGFGQFTIDTVANTLTFHIEFGGLLGTENNAHIHGPAPPGTPAGIIFGLPLGSPKDGVWNYPQAMENIILGGLTYVNIHSTLFGGGEIRGQIVKSKILRYTSTIDAAQETPPNGSPGTGTGTFLIDTVTNRLDYDIAFSGLLGTENNAHIHGPAPPGTPACIVFPLPLGSPKVGTWNYPEGMEADILAGQMYVNIHSTMFPGGEIRGQIVEDCGAGRVNLAGGGPEDVLLVNASPGLPGCRIVTVPVSNPITVALNSSGAGPVNGRYVLYAWACPPQNPAPFTPMMTDLGCFANPIPLTPGDPKPFRCLRGGLPPSVCTGVTTINAPATTPFMVTKGSGLANPITVLLQALLEDTGANALNFSVTNMVVLVVE